MKSGRSNSYFKKIMHLFVSTLYWLIKTLPNKLVLLQVRILGGKIIDSRSGSFDAEYKYFSTSALVELPLDSIKVKHANLGVINVADSPHFKFVNSYVTKTNLDDMNEWRNYQFQHHGLTGKSLAQREDKFKRLIDEFEENDASFECLVSIKRKYAVVLDGTHRLSILASRGSAKNVRCWVRNM